MTNRRVFLAAALSAAVGAQGQQSGKRNMIVRSTRPEDLEMPMDGFGTWITPVDRFFVRSHHYTPKVDTAAWRLEVGGKVGRKLILRIDDLRQMPKAEIVSVLECAGNGRSLYEPPLIGLQWEWGAVGNARWAGVRLADVLARAGVVEPAVEVLFDGADVPVGTMPEFQRSIPLDKAMHRDTLLAYEMNGQTLPASHGYPLRLVVPGWAGDCWMKWVTRIEVRDQPFEGFFMQTAYRYPKRPVPPGSAVDPKEMDPVTWLRMKSVIARPADRSQLPRGPVRITGAAWGGKETVAAVDVSADGGRTWKPARLGRDQSQYGWRLWDAEWTPPQDGYYVLMARARDAAGNYQPVTAEWNPSGYSWDAMPRARVIVGSGAAFPPEAPREQATHPAFYRAACLTCHENDVVEQQRLTRAQWEREVDKMIRWGAPVKDTDRGQIIDYLTRNYGYRPKP